ncbi:MAG TPA: FHA domain-containing protein, partial [Dictyobacter sp.]|nr:FHA domain-containing protein [Dictyobacter sp.]
MAGKTFQITKPVTRLGRGPENDIIISDPSVSRHHAQITWNGQAWSIQLLAEQNNLAVNQLPTHQSLLHDGDTIGLGQGVTFVFSIVMPQAPGYPSPVSPLSPPASPNPYPERPSFPGNQPIQQQQANPYPAQQVSFPGNQPIPQANPYPERLSFPGNQPMPAPPVDRTITSTSIEGSTGPSVPSIEISTNTDHETQKYMFDPAQTVFDIGRNPSNAIVINRPTVSSFHAQIIREGNQLVLIHPNPKRGHTVNGITFQGQRILGNEPFRRVLTRGDIFRISDSNGTFVTLAYNDGSGRVQDAIPEIQSIQLGAPVITIGRAPDNMVVLNHPQISGHHARLEQNRGGYRLIDLGSTNHSYVNAQRVSNRTLEQGDIIRIGPYKLTYT